MELVELLARRDDGDAAAGIVNLLGDLLACERGIDGHIGRADRKRGKIGDDPLPAVLADQSDAVAFFHAEIKERGGQGAHEADKPLIETVGATVEEGLELLSKIWA